MSLTKENLVILKGQTNLVIRATGTTFEPNEDYRCIKQEDGSYVIYGEPIDKDTFNNMFEFLHDKLMREFEALDMLPNGKALSKTAFKNAMDIHQYGRGKAKLFKGFFGGKMSGMIAFDCCYAGDTKASFIEDAYDNYIKLIEGNMTPIDVGGVERGNSGVPIGYGEIYFKKPYMETEKSEIYY